MKTRRDSTRVSEWLARALESDAQGWRREPWLRTHGPADVSPPSEEREASALGGAPAPLRVFHLPTDRPDDGGPSNAATPHRLIAISSLPHRLTDGRPPDAA